MKDDDLFHILLQAQLIRSGNAIGDGHGVVFLQFKIAGDGDAIIGHAQHQVRHLGLDLDKWRESLARSVGLLVAEDQALV